MHLVDKHELKVDDHTHYLIYRRAISHDDPTMIRRELVIATLTGDYNVCELDVIEDYIIMHPRSLVYHRDLSNNVNVESLDNAIHIYFDQCEFFELDDMLEYAEII